VPPRLAVWDLAVRLLHWGLAGLVAADLVLDDGGPLHRTLGYVAAGLVLARLAWAALHRGHAGFAALRPSVRETVAYVRAGMPRCVGHDPLGLWMVWLLWILVLALAITGWTSRLDAFWGDDGIHALHAFLADALLACVALHLVGVGAMSWRWRENLPWSMIAGTKPADPPAPSASRDLTRPSHAASPDRP
jgi:cytochrome b